MSEHNKIVLLQTAFLGDCILTLPLVEKLAASDYRNKIDVLTSSRGYEVFNASPFVEKVLVLDKSSRKLRSVKKIASQLKEGGYSHLYSCHRSLRTSLIALFSSIPHRSGFANSVLSFVYHHTTPYRKDLHEVGRNLMLAGEVPEVLPLPVMNSTEPHSCADTFMKFRSKFSRIVTIATGSVWETKKYPVKSYKEVCDLLVMEGYGIVLIGGKADASEAESIAERNPESILNLTGKLSIPESVWILKRTDVLVTNDSAPTHLGVTADIPVITLYCSTVPGFGFYPYNSGSRFLSVRDIPCKPCGIHGYRECPEKHFRCGTELLPKTVFENIEQMCTKS